jgi:hypothetical protein
MDIELGNDQVTKVEMRLPFCAVVGCEDDMDQAIELHNLM